MGLENTWDHVDCRLLDDGHVQMLRQRHLDPLPRPITQGEPQSIAVVVCLRVCETSCLRTVLFCRFIDVGPYLSAERVRCSLHSKRLS